jgi:hypothetical protein
MAREQNGRTYFSRRFDDIVPLTRGLPISCSHGFHGHQPFRPLPAPTGMPPYHLSLADVLPPEQMAAIAERMVFHMVGDTGAVEAPAIERLSNSR